MSDLATFLNIVLGVAIVLAATAITIITAVVYKKIHPLWLILAGSFLTPIAWILWRMF